MTLKNEEMKNVMTGRGENFTTESLLDYDYWKNNYKLICCDLSKQKVLAVIQKLTNKLNIFTNWIIAGLLLEQKHKILTVLKKEKETNLEFSKGTVKFY